MKYCHDCLTPIKSDSKEEYCAFCKRESPYRKIFSLGFYSLISGNLCKITQIIQYNISCNTTCNTFCNKLCRYGLTMISSPIYS